MAPPIAHCPIRPADRSSLISASVSFMEAMVQLTDLLAMDCCGATVLQAGCRSHFGARVRSFDEGCPPAFGAGEIPVFPIN